MQKITTFLMFESGALEAMDLYASVFKNAKITTIFPGPNGQPMGGTIEIEGQEIHTYNGGSYFKFTEGISLMVNCTSQDEVDHYWNALTANGGKESMCGWLTDKYGVSWQIIPTRLMELITDKDPARAARATEAMLQMRKIDIATIEAAANGETIAA